MSVHTESVDVSATRQAKQTRTLKIVLAINFLMFFIEFKAGMLIASMALLADSLDMLGDAMVYGFSLFVVTQSHAMKAVSALFKGLVMSAFGLFVLWQAIDRFLNPVVPQYEWMGLIGLLALIANMYCFHLLLSHREEDVNMKSVWICSRNDIIANISIVLAAIGVAITSTQWPDLIVGFGIAVLFLTSAFHIIKEAVTQLADQEQSSRYRFGMFRKLLLM